MTSHLTHFDAHGQAHMVDVGHKAATQRSATAQGEIHMQAATLQLILQGNSKKGDVLGIARIAAIQATKKTAELIPLCHQIPLTHVAVEFEALTEKNTMRCTVTTETVAQTGVEMEALTGVQIALLTIYDMCKAVDRGMHIENIRLTHKHGGNSGDWTYAPIA